MLTHLAVRDIVLIERLDLDLAPGLCVLTGETGAGKSIILDSLGLALGGRADRDLVRHGVAQGSVAARFEPASGHPAWAMLEEQAIAAESELVLRRTLGADGRSRAFVNDEPVSGQLLRRLGSSLVDVHGQGEQRALGSPGVHRGLLDAFGGLLPAARAVATAHAALREAETRAAGSREAAAAAALLEDELRHRAAELSALAPRAGEEAELVERRQRLAAAGKLVEALEEVLRLLTGAGAPRERLAQAERRLGRVATMAGGTLDGAMEALGRAQVELDDALAQLGALAREIEAGEQGLDGVEERLFALRDAARKHRVPVEGLAALLHETALRLESLEEGGAAARAAERAARTAAGAYAEAAASLGEARRRVAPALERGVAAELAPLKLDRAAFRVVIEPLDEGQWGPAGRERVAFEIRTNPGQPFGPLAKVASGGEMSRLMLALEVVLAKVGTAPTLIFDEIDAGIGGATADAVGERLARLARERQVLVVTHAPQLAARAGQHVTVRKRAQAGRTAVEVRDLGPAEREHEVARMLAGAEVTEAARAAARSLIERATV